MKEKEMKLLWGRAANRCTICRTNLSPASSRSGVQTLIGEQAHIIGEKPDAARYLATLTPDERDGYANRILLCPNDHTLIDKDELSWPAERLHRRKAEHELWVEETLSATRDAADEAAQLTLAAIIDHAVELCPLEDWRNWSSGILSPQPSVRQDFFDKAFEFTQIVHAAVWPIQYDEMRRAATTLALLLNETASVMVIHGEPAGSLCRAIPFYKRGGYNPNYAADLQRFERWVRALTLLAYDATRAANWFADIVRRDVNPLFFAEKGRFIAIEGPMPDLTDRASIPHFSDDEKLTLPESLRLPERDF